MSYYKKILKEYMKKNPWPNNETTYDASFTQKDYIKFKAKEDQKGAWMRPREVSDRIFKYEKSAGVRVHRCRSKEKLMASSFGFLHTSYQ